MIMKKTKFEEMGGTYMRHGDYLIPCLALPEEEQLFYMWLYVGEDIGRALQRGYNVGSEMEVKRVV